MLCRACPCCAACTWNFGRSPGRRGPDGRWRWRGVPGACDRAAPGYGRILDLRAGGSGGRQAIWTAPSRMRTSWGCGGRGSACDGRGCAGRSSCSGRPGVGRSSDGDRCGGRQGERVIRKAGEARPFQGERLAHAHRLAGQGGRRPAAGPSHQAMAWALRSSMSTANGGRRRSCRGCSEWPTPPDPLVAPGDLATGRGSKR